MYLRQFFLFLLLISVTTETNSQTASVSGEWSKFLRITVTNDFITRKAYIRNIRPGDASVFCEVETTIYRTGIPPIIKDTSYIVIPPGTSAYLGWVHHNGFPSAQRKISVKTKSLIVDLNNPQPLKFRASDVDEQKCIIKTANANYQLVFNPVDSTLSVLPSSEIGDDKISEFYIGNTYPISNKISLGIDINDERRYLTWRNYNTFSEGLNLKPELTVTKQFSFLLQNFFVDYPKFFSLNFFDWDEAIGDKFKRTKFYLVPEFEGSRVILKTRYSIDHDIWGNYHNLRIPTELNPSALTENKWEIHPVEID